MPPRVVIPDASVILKWVLPSENEADVEQSLALRDAIAVGHVQAIVPELWLYEVGNTLSRRHAAHAARALGVLLRFELESAPSSPEWLSLALDLTRKYGVAFYDAAYHAHAIGSGGVFVTADERYVRRAHAAGHVIRLSEWVDLPI